MTNDAAELEKRMQQDRFDALYREMEGVQRAEGELQTHPRPTRGKLTARELRDQMNERRWHVRRHQGGAHDGQKAPGCPYCYAPGPKGDYMPITPAAAAQTFRDVLASEAPE